MTPPWVEQALDLADQCTAMAKKIPSSVTRTKLYAAAYSLRWQVKWAQDHPTCPYCGREIVKHDDEQRKTCHDALSGYVRG
jgi:hypothetical protein